MLSFIVPAHNEEFELPATLAAIHDAGQDRQYEIIVADDASTDATAEIARSAGAKVVSIDRRQIAAARNAGARVACGDILFFVDADTRVSKKLIADALAALDAGFSGGSARVRADGFVPLWGRISLKIFSTLYFANNLGAGAFLFTTRKNYDAVGGLDELYFAGEEVFFSQALKKLGRFKVLSEPMVTSGRKLRMHSGWHVWKQLIRLLLGGTRGCLSRDKLDLWYDGKRETRST